MVKAGLPVPGAGDMQCISVHSFSTMHDRDASGGPGGGGGVACVLHSPLCLVTGLP